MDNTDFFTYTEEQLNEWLTKSYWGVRTEKKEMYTCSSMITMKYSLN